MKHFILIFVLFYSVEGFLQFYPEIPLGERDGGDAGQPLILTPFLESGNIEEGQRLAQVNIPGVPNITSYSGFFTVNKANNSNQFFWYFPPLEERHENAAIIVWLQGGPGASSLYGLFMENGPFEIKEDNLTIRQLSWSKTRHMIYIDNPVGAGFSFTDSGYCINEHEVGEQLYSTVIQFFELFPHLQDNHFYVAGESYGGKYVPALAHYIHKRNSDAKVKINLKGILIGNGLSDPEHQLDYGKYLYQLGLIDSDEEAKLDEIKNDTIELIKKKQWDEASNSFYKILFYIDIFTHLPNFYNYMDSEYEVLFSFGKMVQTTHFRKGIHVGELPFNATSGVVFNSLMADVPKSVAPWIEELLNNYKVVIYSGQLDIMVPYPLTVNYLKHLKFIGAEEYEKAEREYITDASYQVAGYSKTAGNLTEIMIRNAGHMVPADKPNWIYTIIMNVTETHPKSAP